MPRPLLHLGNICIILQGVGDSRRSSQMHPAAFHFMLEPDNGAWLHKALSSLPPTLLARPFKAQFPAHAPEVFILTGKRANKVAAADILDNLEKVRARRPEVLEALVEVWLDNVAQPAAQQDDVTEAPPDALAVLSWLWSSGEGAPAADWRTVQTLTAQLEAFQAERTTLAEELARAQRELAKLTKASAKVQDKIRIEQAERQRLNKELSAKVSALERSEQRNLVLKRDISAYRERVADLEQTLEQQEQRFIKDSGIDQKRHEALSRQHQQLRDDHARLTNDHKTAHRTLADGVRERAEMSRLISSLEGRVAELEEVARLHELPLDAETLQDALILDYETLGDDPRQRFTALLDLYEAALRQEPHPLLEEKTNWGALCGEFQGILLLGLEPLLLDALRLPIRRYLKMSSFSKEALLRSLAVHIESPRLLELRGDAYGG